MSSCHEQEQDYVTVHDKGYTFGHLSFTRIEQNSLRTALKSGGTSNNNYIFSCCSANDILSKLSQKTTANNNSIFTTLF